MSRIDKLLDRFWSDPKPTDFEWDELIRTLSHYGYEQKQGRGSRVRFVHATTKHKISLHKRHPDSTLLSYQIDKVRESLNSEGIGP